MRHWARNRGTTLVEMISSMACASFIILGCTVAFGTSALMSAKAANQVAIYRDASAALRLMQRVLRGVDHAAITISSGGATLALNTGAYFAANGSNLTYYNGSSSITVLQDLSSVTFNVVAGTSPNSYVVTVALNLSSGGSTLNRQSTIELRN
jgi:Tfp pilus assembly protein PilW